MKVLRDNKAVSVIQCFSNSCEEEALSREHAMIMATRATSSNIYRGSPKGLMREGMTDIEVENLGVMLLYSVLRQCMVEIPSKIYLHDI